MENERLEEAIFIFLKYCQVVKEMNGSELYSISSSLPENMLNATLRLLAANNLLMYKDKGYYAIAEKLSDIKQVINNNINTEIEILYDKINQKIEGSFFENISDLEYEIYSRCNYEISYEMGRVLCRVCNFSKSRIIDMGGNSGGLANAILLNYPSSHITVIDKAIPCAVGEEFKKINGVSNIRFVEGDFFSLDKLKLSERIDYIILSNVLHDFSDNECKAILKGCKKHVNSHTKIIIIEDILNNEIEPLQVLEYGLRLSINTYKGKQRTVEELNNLLSEISFSIKKKHKINEVQSAIICEIS